MEPGAGVLNVLYSYLPHISFFVTFILLLACVYPATNYPGWLKSLIYYFREHALLFQIRFREGKRSILLCCALALALFHIP